jgi:hypothetical protein
MSEITTEIRERAIMRGLDFIYALACDERQFGEYGYDLINCFYFISETSLDPVLRRTARRMGKERAGEWRRKHSNISRRADAGTVFEYIQGSYAADKFGFRDPATKERIRDAAKRITALDYFYFDPANEPPPSDASEPCWCGLLNERGRKTCRKCKRRLNLLSRYGIWYDALIAAYTCERYGVIVGARYVDVLKWLPTMRPYPKSDDPENSDFYDSVYAATHIVYTLNDYSTYRLSPKWLPQEFDLLKDNLKSAIDTADPEMMGEFLDALKAFGLEESHPLIREGIEFLLSTQNADGSWGSTRVRDTYQRYHPTWTAIDGLRDYRWRGERLSFPRIKPLLDSWNARSAT